MTDNLRHIGFFRDLRHGMPGQPSLRESLRAVPHEMEATVVAYLSTGQTLAAAGGVVHDEIDPQGGVIGPLKVLTDGTWVWPSDLAHYVAKYHVRLPKEFIEQVVRGRGERV